MRDIDLFHISFPFSPALRAILKDKLEIAVVKPDLSFGAVLRRRPDVAPLALLGGTHSHNEAMIMVFGGTIFMGTLFPTNKASKIGKIFNALQFLPTDGDRE